MMIKDMITDEDAYEEEFELLESKI